MRENEKEKVRKDEVRADRKNERKKIEKRGTERHRHRPDGEKKGGRDAGTGGERERERERDAGHPIWILLENVDATTPDI